MQRLNEQKDRLSLDHQKDEEEDEAAVAEVEDVEEIGLIRIRFVKKMVRQKQLKLKGL